MASLIRWVPPTNSSVGSVLIYRAVDNIADHAGTRSIIATIDAKDANSNWVVSYTDSTGTMDYYYRVQFWDGVGSSQLSDPVSGEYSPLLCSFEDVRRVMRMSALNNDIGSEEIFYAIKDATDEIYTEYGNPVKKTVTMIRDPGHNYYPGSLTYDFTGNHVPVYQINDMTVGTGGDYQVSGSSYTTNLDRGEVVFTADFVSSTSGTELEIEWIPKIYNMLCKNMAALSLIETSIIINGEDITTPTAKRMFNAVTRYKETLRPKGCFGHRSSFPTYDERGATDVLEQDFEDSY